MTDTRADCWNAMLSLLTAATIVCAIPYDLLGLPKLWIEYERSMLYALAFVVTVGHLHYGQGVVREMCSHFRIKCFKVRISSHSSVDNTNTKNGGLTSNNNPANNGRHSRRKLM